jgi:hypothetical protein
MPELWAGVAWATATPRGDGSRRRGVGVAAAACAWSSGPAVDERGVRLATSTLALESSRASSRPWRRAGP